MKKILTIVSLLLTVLGLSACKASNTDSLVIGMECGYQPFNWTLDSKSNYTLEIDGTTQYADGYDVQVSRYLGEALNKKVVVKKTAWEDLIPSLNNGNIDLVLAGMTDTPERREEIDFSSPYLESDLAFLIKKNNIPKGVSKENPISYDALLELFKNKNLICQRGVVGDDFIDTYFSDVDSSIIHSNPLDTYPLAALDVSSGSAFAMPAELPVIEAMTNLSPDTLGVLYVDYKSFLSSDDLNGLKVSIGIKKGNSNLLKQVNNALARLSNARRNQMMANASLRSNGATTTDKTIEKLVIGMECAYQPFNWTINNANQFSLPIDGSTQFADGYDIQVANYIGSKLGREVVIKKTTWEDLIPSLNNGNIDLVLAGMTDTPERREEIDFTSPYLTSDLAFLIRKNNIPAGNSKENPLGYNELLELFKNKNLVCQRGVVGDDFIDTYFSNVDSSIIHSNPLDTYPLAALDVSSGSAFAMPAELPVIEAMSNIDSSLGVLYVDYEAFLSDDDLNGLKVSIGVKKGNTNLLNAVNEALATLSDDERAAMMGASATRSAGTSDQETTSTKTNVFLANAKWIVYGTLTTIILAVFGTGIGLVIGIFIAYGKNIKTHELDNKVKRCGKSAVKWICQIYSTILRGTPMMVQALIFKYGCQALGLNWDLVRLPGEINNVINGWLFAGLIVITLNTSAYMAEIVQSGLNGVDKGQEEGARSLGMSGARTSISIILPQALRNALPTIGNELIVNIKDSSVLNVIAVTELFYRIKDIATTNYAFLNSYIVIAVIYLCLTLITTFILKLVEHKMDGVKFNLNPFRRKGDL